MEHHKKIRMDMKLKQQLNLSAQLLQSMEMLQMTSQELLEYLQNASMENPVLELEDAAALRREYADLQRQQPWITGGGEEMERADPFGGRRDRETESLEAFLRDQLERQKLPKQVLAVAEYLAANLTEDGYLAEEDLEAVREMGVPAELVSRALEELQRLEPAGRSWINAWWNWGKNSMKALQKNWASAGKKLAQRCRRSGCSIPGRAAPFMKRNRRNMCVRICLLWRTETNCGCWSMNTICLS